MPTYSTRQRAYRKRNPRFRQTRRRRASRPAAAANKARAKKVALGLKETKKKQLASIAGVETWSSTNNWLVWQPLNLDKSSTDSESDRQSNLIYAMNCRLKLDIETNPKSISPYHLRFVQGWAKGDVSYPTQRTPIAQITSTQMTSTNPTYQSDFDTDDFKIVSDKVIRVTPKQIYDSSSGTSTGEETGLTDDNRGLWPQVTRTMNFKFNRKFKYEGSMASELVGWVPFFAVQLDKTKFGLAHTGGNTTSYPSPNVAYEITTYFKDIN